MYGGRRDSIRLWNFSFLLHCRGDVCNTEGESPLMNRMHTTACKDRTTISEVEDLALYTLQICTILRHTRSRIRKDFSCNRSRLQQKKRPHEAMRTSNELGNLHTMMNSQPPPHSRNRSAPFRYIHFGTLLLYVVPLPPHRFTLLIRLLALPLHFATLPLGQRHRNRYRPTETETEMDTDTQIGTGKTTICLASRAVRNISEAKKQKDTETDRHTDIHAHTCTTNKEITSTFLSRTVSQSIWPPAAEPDHGA